VQFDRIFRWRQTSAKQEIGVSPNYCAAGTTAKKSNANDTCQPVDTTGRHKSNSKKCVGITVDKRNPAKQRENAAKNAKIDTNCASMFLVAFLLTRN
jgi:hypothetical protein